MEGDDFSIWLAPHNYHCWEAIEFLLFDWSLWSSRMWCIIAEQLVPNVLRQRCGHVFRNWSVQEEFSFCDHPVVQCYIPEEQRPQLHCCKSLKACLLLLVRGDRSGCVMWYAKYKKIWIVFLSILVHSFANDKLVVDKCRESSQVEIVIVIISLLWRIQFILAWLIAWEGSIASSLHKSFRVMYVCGSLLFTQVKHVGVRWLFHMELVWSCHCSWFFCLKISGLWEAD